MGRDPELWKGPREVAPEGTSEGSANSSLDAGLGVAFEGGAAFVAAGARPPNGAGASVTRLLRKLGARAQRTLLRDESEPEGSALQRASHDSVHSVAAAGRYHVLGEIGRGGVGIVLKSHDEDLGRNVAIKVLREDRARDPALLLRFIEEAQIAGQLEHPGIAPVYDLGLSADERPYFSMRLIKGRTLASLLTERKSPLEGRPRFLSIFSQVCQTMAYAHARGVIHRDLKPTNIMVGAFGEVQVVDWGFAKVLARADRDDERRSLEPSASVIETVRSGSGSGSSSESVEGSVMGTPAYMSPEQARGKIEDIDERADVFALGAILCEILTGLPPFQGENSKALESAAWSRLEAAAEALDRSGADRELVELCRRCLEPGRDRRLRHAGVLANEVSAYLASVEERARAAQIAAAEVRVKAEEVRKQHKLALALAGSVVVTVLLGGGGWVWLERDRAARLRDTENRVNVALSEATLRRGEKDFRTALAAAGRARALLETGTSTTAFRERVEDVASAIESEAAVFEQREKLDHENRDLLARLEDMREPESTSPIPGYKTDWARLAADYESAFSASRLDLFAVTVEEAADALRERGIEVELSSALDEWSDACRRSGLNGKAEHLAQVALAADGDDSRTRLRRALLDGRTEELECFAKAADLRALPAPTLNLLAGALSKAGACEESLAVYRLAQRFHPADYVLNMNLARGLRELEPPRAQEALGFYRAAMALRPTHVEARHEIIVVLSDELAEQSAALEEAREAVHLFPQDGHLQWHLGVLLKRLGNYDAALAAALEAFRLQPDFNTNVLLGDALEFKGDHENAIAAYRAAIRLKPYESSVHNNLGIMLWGRGDHEGAIAAFRAAIDRKPDNAQAYDNLGRALDYRGDHEGAIAAYRAAIGLTPDNAQAYNNLGIALADNGNHEDAIAAYRAAIGLNSDLSEAWGNLGAALNMKGDYEGSIEATREAIRLNVPNAAEAYNTLGMALEGRGDHEGAIAAYRAAIGLNSDLSEAWGNLGIALNMKGDYEGSIEATREAIRLNVPNASLAYHTLGEALAYNGNHEDAIAAWRAAIGLNSNSSETWGNLGIALNTKGDYEGSIEATREAIRLNVPNASMAYYTLGEALANNGNHEAAIAAYLNAIRLSPADPSRSYSILAWLGATCSDPAFRDPEEALQLAERAVQLHEPHDPDCALARFVLGAACYRVEHWERAVEELEEALKRQPEYAMPAFWLAMCHWQLLHEDEAHEWFDKGVKWTGNGPATGKDAPTQRSPSEEEQLRRIRAEAAELLEIEDDILPGDKR